jgi:mannose-6-phosphate isomerase-like protein (cupin superfamily)
MPKVFRTPSIIKAAGNKNKKIQEYIGRTNSGDTRVSIARMNSPEGWKEPGQTPEFDEYTIILRGMLKVETENQTYELHENEAILIEKGEWVRYSSPETGGAVYMAVCLPAFSPATVHRDENE